MTLDPDLRLRFLDLSLEFEDQVARIDPGDTVALYDLIHRTAREIAPTDALRICLYSEPDQTLYFPYCHGNGNCQAPTTQPLGDCPASRVIRRREPILLNGPMDGYANRSPERYDPHVPTGSSVYLPMFVHCTSHSGAPLGVLSVHSRQSHVFNEPVMTALQWLATRASTALARFRRASHLKECLLLAEGRNIEQQHHIAAMAERFLEILRGLTKSVSELAPLIPADHEEAAHAVRHLLLQCRHGETEACHMPLTVREVSRTVTAAPVEPQIISSLTEREHEILELIASGATNAVIAEKLFVSVDTVKFHCNNLYRKLGVTNRNEATRMLLSRA